MPGKVTKNFRVHTARQFYEQFGEAAPSQVYFFIARPNTWTDELNPPTPNDTTVETAYDLWDNIMSLKHISPSDASFGVDRVDWTTGTVYDQYTSTTEFWTNNKFHVITEDFHVYKCLSNNKGAASTVKPTGTPLTPFTTSDGYVWKYMFTVAASDALKFSTVRMIPVKTLTADDSSVQWDVQQTAKAGEISSVTVNTGGSSYQEHTGTLALGGTTTVTVASGASATGGIYINSDIYISAGTGAGQIRRIANYNGSTKVVTVNGAFSPATDGTSTYIIAPRVLIFGNGVGAKAYSRVVGGAIDKITMINYGNTYTYTTGSISANNGTGATVTPQIGPKGGHGSDAVSELFAHNVIMNVKMTGSESNTFIIGNDFRTVGLIVDPVINANSAIAQGTSYNNTTRIKIDNASGTFSADEVITGATSGATGRIVEYFSNNTVAVTGNQKSFTSLENLTGGTSGATGRANTITLPTLRKYGGKLLYIENRSPVSRSADQQEDVKIIIRF
jgi:hypothetical protein